SRVSCRHSARSKAAGSRPRMGADIRILALHKSVPQVAYISFYERGSVIVTSAEEWNITMAVPVFAQRERRNNTVIRPVSDSVIRPVSLSVDGCVAEVTRRAAVDGAAAGWRRFSFRRRLAQHLWRSRPGRGRVGRQWPAATHGAVPVVL